MIRYITENLARQSKAFQLLKLLLEEEYSRLMERKPQSVSRIEMPIQELMRQLAGERITLKRLMNEAAPEGVRLRDLPGLLGGEAGEDATVWLAEIDELEQECSRQAGKNQHLAMGLLDQSRGMLEFLHKKVQPKSENTYSARGRFSKSSAGPKLLSGRL